VAKKYLVIFGALGLVWESYTSIISSLFQLLLSNMFISMSVSLKKLKLEASFMKFLKLPKGRFKNTVFIPPHKVAQKIPIMLLVT
jgi:hypothetical protein